MNIPLKTLSPQDPALPGIWQSHDWGSSFRLLEQERYSVRHVIIHPGRALRLECHLHRVEHWLVVAGSGRVEKNDRTFDLFEGESLDIGIGETHGIANPGHIDLHMIEVRMGCYLGDDDLVQGPRGLQS